MALYLYLITGGAMRSFTILLMFLFSSLNLFPQTYLDTAASAEARAADLLSRMTLDEKLGQMTQADFNAVKDLEDIKRYFLGSMLSGGSSDPADNYPLSWASAYDELQQKALETRLKIPLIYGVDAVHGHNNVLSAVIFPHNIGLGCTRNPELVKEISRITAKEVAATGIDWTFAPCVAVPRDERWGRTYEGFSEDPALVSLLGAAAVKGLQGDSLQNPESVLACAKHFIADGGTYGGVDQGNSVMTEEELRRIHLPGHIEAIKEGVGSVMASYSSWNGVKMHGHKYLLTDVLKGELGFKGFVVSDWGGVDQLPGDYAAKVERSINAGVDMVMVPDNYPLFFNTLKDLVLQNRVPVQRIDDAVLRILTIKFKMCLFERPFTDMGLLPSIGSAEHRAVGRQAVRESVVLLAKKEGIFPLKKEGAKINIAGSHADNLGYQCGGWTIHWQGGSGNITTGTTVLNAIKKAAPGAEIVHSADGTALAADADYTIIVTGETPYAEMMGDKQDLSLSKQDIALLKKAKSLGKPVIVILISGRPLIIEAVLHYADVVFAAWLPGTEGEGITDILFGGYEPKGMLSYTWPRSMQQIPINTRDAEYAPLYPFGHGFKSLADTAGSNPYLYSAAVSGGSRVEVSFNKKMAPLSSAEGFTVRSSMAPVINITAAEMKEGDPYTFVFTLDVPVGNSAAVTLDYSGGKAAAADGGKLQTFTGAGVYNEPYQEAHIIPGRFEAEDYTAMEGVQTENCSDAGGGINVGWVDDGDWMEYNVDVRNSGRYLLAMRTAAQSAEGKVEVRSGSELLLTKTLPVTGGWQNWETAEGEIDLDKGVQTLRFTAVKGGFNLNWFMFTVITSAGEERGDMLNYELAGNYPNPFNPATTISYELPEAGMVLLKVYDILGREVKILVNEFQVPGRYSAVLNAYGMPAGMYVYRLTVNNYTAVRKMTLLK